MNLVRRHPLDLDDANFYKMIISELISMETKLNPILHDILQLREKTQKLRTTLAAVSTPAMIKYKKVLESENHGRKRDLEELQSLKKPLEETMYEKLLLPAETEINI